MNDNSPFANIDVDLNHVPELQRYNDYANSIQYFDVDRFNSMNNNNLDLKILHLNIRSLGSNMQDLCALLSMLSCRFDAICITESWLNDHTEPLYGIPGYRAYHSLRPVGLRGGGISVFISQGFQATEVRGSRISNQTIESLFINVNQPGANKSFILGTVYKPPSSDCVAFTDSLCNLIGGLSLRSTELILCGDFNLDLFAVDTHVPTAEFVHRLFSLSLTPIISKPTRVTDHSATLIDNIFIDSTLEYRAGIFSSDISDHFPIFVIKKKLFSHCHQN